MTFTSGIRKGDTFEGIWKDGKKNGHGKYIYTDGEKYESEFKDDKQNGHGTLTWPSG